MKSKLSLKKGRALRPAPHCSVLLVTLLEPLDAAALGLAAKTSREERMALRADVDAKLLLRGTRRKLVAAAASHRRLEILGMNSFFHALHLTFLPY